jgi:putative membrane protein
MRNLIKLAALACAFGLAGPASADHDKDTKGKDDKPLTDTTFVDKVVSSNMAEIEMGRIAHARAQSDEVRRFAARMVQDHSKAYQDLIPIVSEQRIAIPEKCMPEHAKVIQHFASAAVRNFDQEYMKHMVESHEKGVDLFTRATKEITNERLKGYAEKTLPVVKEHLKVAKEVYVKVGGTEVRDSGSATRTDDGRGRTDDRRTDDRRRDDRQRDERRDERRADTGSAKALTDQEFVNKAASSGKAEVAIGKAGQEKAQNADVKKFAERVVTDHTKSNDELMRIAKDAGVNIPDRPAAEHADKVKHFEGDTRNFDREFVNHMVDSHNKGVELFTKASKELKNEQLRSFAEKTLPTLKEHLTIAKRLQEQVGRRE